jgi:hypothetical protein
VFSGVGVKGILVVRRSASGECDKTNEKQQAELSYGVYR